MKNSGRAVATGIVALGIALVSAFTKNSCYPCVCFIVLMVIIWVDAE